MAKEKLTIDQQRENLKLAEKQVASEAIKSNPTLLKSLNGKIHALRAIIKAHDEKNPPSKSDATAKAETKKSETTKKETKEAKPTSAKKEEKKPSEKAPASPSKVKIGDTVKFLFKKLQKDVTGKVVYVHPSKGTCTVEHKDGISYPKLEKVTIVK